MHLVRNLKNTLGKDALTESKILSLGEGEGVSARGKISMIMRFIGIAGVLASSAMFIWFLTGLTGAIPSLVDVFGVPGLRVPAGIAISGLLAASVGFHDY